FVVHDGARPWDSSLEVADGLWVTTSRDILEALAGGDGPEHAAVALGCAGWGAGQLEYEIGENSWLTAPVRREILFSLPLDQRWQAAAGGIGVDMMRMAGHVGHAWAPGRSAPTARCWVSTWARAGSGWRSAARTAPAHVRWRWWTCTTGASTGRRSTACIASGVRRRWWSATR